VRELPRHGRCFVCGENPRGLEVTWRAAADGTVYTEVSLGEDHQGPPGHVHGGASAALLDEAMGAATWVAGYGVVAVHLECDYRCPLPLGRPFRVEGRVTGSERKKVFTSGTITLEDGTVAVEGKGIYVTAPQFFTGGFYEGFDPEESGK
jgi:acyl-coenzyme A thioesterase PaaI-like protein